MKIIYIASDIEQKFEINSSGSNSDTCVNVFDLILNNRTITYYIESKGLNNGTLDILAYRRIGTNV